VTSVVLPSSYLVSCDRTSPLSRSDTLGVSFVTSLRHQNTVWMANMPFFGFESLGSWLAVIED
jgi:hypothetical protein